MRPRALPFLLAALAAAPSAAGQRPASALLAVEDADPLELARVVAREGDAAVLGHLSSAAPLELQLAAARATPHLAEPELALERLAQLAAGRDEALAPVAARAALRLARDLSADALSRREAGASPLRGAASALAALGRDETARADVRRAAFHAADALDHLLAPPRARP